MTSGRSGERRVAGAAPAAPQPGLHVRRGFRLLGCLFARKGVGESVATQARFDASPETLWNRLMFYEEVPGRPPLLLRVLLPWPVRTEGEKTRAGTTVRCIYRGGVVVKRITAVEPPHRMQFEVIEQRLGIEGCISVLGGRYEIRRRGGGAEVVLTTNYRSFLRPRSLWRPVEKFLAGRLHRHILGGMRAAAARPASRPLRPAVAAPESAPPGGLACTASRSRCRR
jgi:Polyketide cyclase / dehydrase and lipid transport